MNSISYYTMQELYWYQPDANILHWELRTGVETLAILAYEGEGRSQAVLKTDDGTWHMYSEPEHFLQVQAVIDGQDDPIADYQPKWTGSQGQLTLRGMREYRFTAANFWATRWELRDDVSETVLLKFRGGVPDRKLEDSFKTELTMEVASNMLTGSDLALCSGLCLYILLLNGGVLSEGSTNTAVLATIL